MSRPNGVLLSAVCLVFVGWVLSVDTPSLAQEEGVGFMAVKGRTSYRLYCANCHGPEGLGNGNVAQFLTIPPADLTRIEQRYGEWPEEQLQAIIDGREKVRAHGSREMPIWGDVFQSPWGDDLPVEGEDGEQRADRKIRELIVFLKTIQVSD